MPGSNNQAKTRDGIVDISFLEYINADQTIELFTNLLRPPRARRRCTTP